MHPLNSLSASQPRMGGAVIVGARPMRSVTARVAAILLTVTDGSEPSLSQVARRTGLSLSTTHRLLGSLVHGQLLERSATGRYLVRRMPQSPLGQNQRTVEAPLLIGQILDDLAVCNGRRARFGTWRGTHISYLERQPGSMTRTWTTGLVLLPPHATALGKVLLAYAPPTLLEQIVDQGPPNHTEPTVTTVQDLRRALAMVRRNRFAVIRAGFIPGRSAAAVPVQGPDGDVVGALELALDNFARDLPRARASLSIASRALGRAFATRSAGLSTGTGSASFDWSAGPASPLKGQ